MNGAAGNAGALARLLHFSELTRRERTAAIRRMALAGHGDHTIAHATGLCVEQVRRALAECAA
ncbi:MAG: hypothetical protein JO299_05750, partial [Gammaproteobacteria bacterium]|nr:hypothetical protein [Gammaproteobacteria bacterium]